MTMTMTTMAPGAAALKVMSQLTMPWPLFYFFFYFLVPSFIRDFFYRIVASNRCPAPPLFASLVVVCNLLTHTHAHAHIRTHTHARTHTRTHTHTHTHTRAHTRTRTHAHAHTRTRRYSWFGKMDACRRPTPQLRARFLDADDLFKPKPARDDHEQPSPPLQSQS
jgi:predicted DCC family thiol-disulfide oxidoreductase YuxK